jgi:DNA-binding CsgD family transcriptional regulator
MPNATSSTAILTPRQIYYMQLIGDGLTKNQIAQVAGRSRVTVYRLLTQARERLGAETLPQAIAIAALLGLIQVRSAVFTADGSILGYTLINPSSKSKPLPISSKRLRSRRHIVIRKDRKAINQ